MTLDLRRVEAALRYLLDVLDEAQSGYIPGCGEDLKWDTRKEDSQKDADEILADVRAAIAESEAVQGTERVRGVGHASPQDPGAPSAPSSDTLKKVIEALEHINERTAHNYRMLCVRDALSTLRELRPATEEEMRGILRNIGVRYYFSGVEGFRAAERRLLGE